MTVTIVSSGQNSTGLIVTATNSLTVLSGGSVTNTAVQSGGVETLSGDVPGR